jgi:hypothetical protein
MQISSELILIRTKNPEIVTFFDEIDTLLEVEITTLIFYNCLELMVQPSLKHPFKRKNAPSWQIHFMIMDLCR